MRISMVSAASAGLAVWSIGLTVSSATADSPQAFDPIAFVAVSGCDPNSWNYDQPGWGFNCSVDAGSADAGYLTVTNGRVNPEWPPATMDITVSGTGAIAGTPYGYAFSTFGVTGAVGFNVSDDATAPPAYVSGGSVTITSSADITWENAIASDIYFAPPAGQYDDAPDYIAYGGGALVGLSIGAEGFSEKSKNSEDPNFDGGAGGDITITNSGTITVGGSGAYVPYGSTTIPIALNAIGAFSLGGAGYADKTDNVDHAGTGGAGGSITVTNTGTISVTNVGSISTHGIFAISEGGVGSNRDGWAASAGGDGGTVSVTNSGSISVSAPQAVGIEALSIGGTSDFDNRYGGGQASGAGNGGPVTVGIQSGGIVRVSDGIGIGVMAISAGGDADNTWEGSGGPVTVTVDEGATIDTTDANNGLSIGVLAISAGSIGDIAPFETQAVNSAFPGSPGSVSVTNNGTVTTSGSMAIGVAAVSVGGASIVTNADTSASNVLGNVADGFGGFDGSGSTITNTGSVTTLGLAAHGLLAQSVGGGGGLLNIESNTAAISLGSQTTGSGGGNGAAVSVVNSGSVTTGDGSGGGYAAFGIVAQSIGGGGGGTSGAATFLGGLDADGSGGGSGGTVTVKTSGESRVTTKDDTAIGILAQSVGGGGGNGANSWGLVAAVGGQGGNGGAGGDIAVTLADTGGVMTEGTSAAGVIAQSVGGGGGNGGSAESFGLMLSMAVGGGGGSGGSGGTITVSNGTLITTAADQSWGVVAHSVGGGGGSGGAASAYSAGVITVALALGGTGGNGGDGGAITVTNTGSILTGYAGSTAYAYSGGGPETNGADAHGVLAQSIGGGGGAGGSATARSLGFPSTDIPTITVDFAHGGKGGAGGDGGEITLTNTGTVKTAGDGAVGLLAHSVGGGGGAGGDSTAAAYSLQGGIGDINLSVALGGSGATGGSGGKLTVSNGASTNCTACDGAIETYGDNAIGIQAQSVGGGGGAGGTGNASTSAASLGNLLTNGTGVSFSASASVGGSGGTGNLGGAVTVSNLSASTILTSGSSSHGIHAQSIGGGGGNAGSSSAGSGAGKIKLDVSVGGNGGSGNDGGAVTVTNDGTITTGGSYTMEDGTVVATGGDAIGIFAQSVGGGGGTGGGTDPATTFGFNGQFINTVKSVAQKGLTQSPSLSISYSASVDVGGKGGAGGGGGDVTVTNTGSITTYGQRSYGIEAQSIGGGGGNGGSATSNTSSTWAKINSDFNAVGSHIAAATSGSFSMSLGANVSVGGVAGAGSTGGTVQVTNSGAITTAGYGAHAILAQSVGGGGGVGGDGTPGVSGTLGIGAGYSAAGGDGNSGGAVTVSESGQITAVGDDAYGIFAQSIGGGGGVAGAGCTNSSPQYSNLGVKASQCLNTSLSGTSESFSAATVSLDIGIEFKGSSGIYGAGNTVTIDKSAGRIVTGGARAMGIVAQSIGGGGGLAVGSNDNISDVSFESVSETGNGGAIALTLGESASVTTYGDGAWGIFAQSIGAGGGFFGDPSLSLSFEGVNVLPVVDDWNASGGDITVNLAGNIATSGTNAHGLVVQTSAAGNSGGLSVNGFTVLGGDLGSTQSTAYGVGGTITVTQTGGTISASGSGAVGILAQSIGTIEQQSQITIDVSGTVQGGVGSSAAGILVSGGLTSANVDTGTPANQITIEAGGSVSTADGVSGMAILALASWVAVTNQGDLIGSIGLYEGSSPNTGFANNTLSNTGFFASGPVIDVGAVINAGTLSVGGDRNVATSAFGGDFEQTGAGILTVDINALGPQTADLLQVAGEADVGGGIKTLSSNLLPGSYTVLEAGSLIDEGFTGVAASLLFDWSATFGATNLTISPNADFTPSGAALTTNEASLAAYLQRTWDASGSDSLAPLYGALSDLYTGTDYAAALDDISGETLSVHANDQALATRIGLDGAFSCPVFVGDDTLLGETSCIWGKAEGGLTRHGTSTGTPGYKEDVFTLRAGGQGEVAPDWFVGGSAAYSTTSADADGLGAGSDGQRFDASLAVKRVREAWYFGLGGNLGYGWYDNHRRVSIYGPSQLVTSSSNVLTAGARARVQYEVPFANWYLRPRADVDLLYAHVPSYGESGPTGVTMDVRAQNETTVAFAPYLEVGGRFDLGQEWVVRPYAGAGVVAMTNDTWTTEASLKGAPASAGTFEIESDVPNLLGQFDLGVQLTRADRLQARLELGLKLGDEYQSGTGSLRFGFEF
ncbi:hypothetical protein [Amorphus sp. 3PC139-8]|uniref:hypothetical protein n=1 Tax=Amorphus sp. 3PC139-8 TaxID=2735676 RepID=UPI00345D35AE